MNFDEISHNGKICQVLKNSIYYRISQFIATYWNPQNGLLNPIDLGIN